MALGPGARLDVYEIVGPLDSGGMGEVWLARDTNLGRKVAIKVLPADLSGDAIRVARFQQEARLASSLNHPNICTIHALGAMLDGRQFIAMELVEGITLRRRLGGARLALREMLDLAIQIASALTAAHTAGVVHRDLKPENVMLRPDGVVKVLDFGLAKFAWTGPASTTEPTRTLLRTDDGIVMGTVAYMSPEQARGQEVDPRTDIWSLGAVLYEGITGRRPFTGPSNSDVIAGILEREPDRLARIAPDTPSELQRIVGKTLRKDREQRYQSMKDLLLDMQALREDVAVQARSSGEEREAAGSAMVLAPTSAPAAPTSTPPPRSSAEHLFTQVRRHQALVVLIALFFVAAPLLGAWWVVHNRHSADARVRSGSLVQRNLTRLTFDPGLQTDVTWSPDGRFIAYASDQSGNFDIWVQPASGGDPVQVTKSPAPDTQPDWSPDGSTLVFQSARDGGGLFVVPALGGPEQRVTSFGMHPQWVANGSEILFMASDGSPDEAAAGTVLKTYVTTTGRGSPTEILSAFLEKGQWYWASGHPDGRVSVYGLQRDRAWGFFTVSRDGREVTRSDYAPHVPASLRAEAEGIRRFQWNPSGTALYIEAVAAGVSNLWKVNVDPRTLQWLSAERLTTSSNNEGASALSRDGSRIAFTARDALARLWTFALDAGGRLVDKGKPITEDGADVQESDLSRDGRMVAFVMARAGRKDTDLWTTEIETGRRELIAKNVAGPRWSFDGTRLAYVAWPDRLLARNLGDGERTIAHGSDQSLAPLPTDWTPDGTAVVASWIAKRGSTVPFAVTLWPTAENANKPGRILLADPHANLYQGRVSPNGRWISFVASMLDDPGRTHILVAPATGAPPPQWVEVVPGIGSADKPRWSADGRMLYFISRRPNTYFNLCGVRFDAEAGRAIGEPFVLTQFDSPSRSIANNVDSTETGVGGRRVMLTLRSVTGSIWMIDNVDK